MAFSEEEKTIIVLPTDVVSLYPTRNLPAETKERKKKKVHSLRYAQPQWHMHRLYLILLMKKEALQTLKGKRSIHTVVFRLFSVSRTMEICY